MSQLIEQAHDNFRSGVTTVGQTVIRLLTSPLRVYHSVQLVADANNSGTVYVGSSRQDAHPLSVDTGYPLVAGERLEIAIDDASKIAILASASNQKIRYLAN